MDQPVRRLRRADLVEPDLLALDGRLIFAAARRRIEARIEEAAAVPAPRQRRIFDPLDPVVERLAAVGIDDAQDAPVRAAILHRIEQIAPIVRGEPFGQRRRPVLREAVGVEKFAFLALQPLAHIERRLVLQARIARVEIAATRLARRPVALEIVELRHAVAQRVAPGERLEIGEGRVILGRDPGLHILVAAHVILEPAIGVSHSHAELGFDEVLPPRLRIGERRSIEDDLGPLMHRDRQRRIVILAPCGTYARQHQTDGAQNGPGR
jgi:hypothetical protein